MRREVHGAPLPECAPAYWLSYERVRESHFRCQTPREAIERHEDGTTERVMVDCPCPHHTGGEIPDVYRPEPGPHMEAARPFLESKAWPPSYRGGER